MLMFWDALREAARRRQDKKSNIPSPNEYSPKEHLQEKKRKKRTQNL